MKRFMMFFVFVMLFGVMVGQAFGEGFILASGGNIQFMGAKEYIENSPIIKPQAGTRRVAIDVLVDNRKSKTDLDFGNGEYKPSELAFIFRDSKGYKYTIITWYLDFPGDFWAGVPVKAGDFHRGWVLVDIPLEVSIDELYASFRHLSDWVKVKP